MKDQYVLNCGDGTGSLTFSRVESIYYVAEDDILDKRPDDQKNLEYNAACDALIAFLLTLVNSGVELDTPAIQESFVCTMYDIMNTYGD